MHRSFVIERTISGIMRSMFHQFQDKQNNWNTLLEMKNDSVQ